MFFGLPWFAIIAIVAIAGGLFYAYKEKELEVEEKIQVKAREVHDLEKLVHNLKNRLDEIESKLDRQAVGKEANKSTSQIEINDEFESQKPDFNKDSKSKKVNS